MKSKTVEIKDPPKSWSPGSQEVDVVRVPVHQALVRNGVTGDAFTDIYNRVRGIDKADTDVGGEPHEAVESVLERTGLRIGPIRMTTEDNMKASEIIGSLKRGIEAHGDLPVGFDIDFDPLQVWPETELKVDKGMSGNRFAMKALAALYKERDKAYDY